MLKNNIYESELLNLKQIWNFCSAYAKTVAESKWDECFMHQFSVVVTKAAGFTVNDFANVLETQARTLQERGMNEINHWENVKISVSNYSKEKAVKELIKAMKIDGKIKRINAFMRGLPQ